MFRNFPVILAKDTNIVVCIKSTFVDEKMTAHPLKKLLSI